MFFDLPKGVEVKCLYGEPFVETVNTSPIGASKVCDAKSTEKDLSAIGFKASKESANRTGHFCIETCLNPERYYTLHINATSASPVPTTDAGSVRWIDPATGRPSEGVRVCVGSDGAAIAFTGDAATPCMHSEEFTCNSDAGTNLAFIQWRGTQNDAGKRSSPDAAFGTTTVCLDRCGEPGRTLTVDWTTKTDGKCQ